MPFEAAAAEEEALPVLCLALPPLWPDADAVEEEADAGVDVSSFEV
jgi:hypothetical protein